MASEKLKREVFDKATPVRGRDPEAWRRDVAGNLIRYASHGTHGEYGWEIDHKVPVSKGGSDNIRNLQALHHEDNAAKSDKHPHRHG